MPAAETRDGKGEAGARARSIGPAAWRALSAGAPRLEVHSVFAATLNLEVEGTGRLVALRGPGGPGFPHAIVLAEPQDFATWRVPAGSPARLAGSSIRLRGEMGTVAVELQGAELSRWPGLPPIPAIGDAYRTCLSRLAARQAVAGCDLRVDALRWAATPTTALGARLARATLELGAASRSLAGWPEAIPAERVQPSPAAGAIGRRVRLCEAVAGLLGLGAGLTPSGDDLLCGFLAAARARAEGAREVEQARAGGEGSGGLVDTPCGVLCSALEVGLGRTGSLSGSLIRYAMEDLWPTPLLDLAGALAADHRRPALAALEELCRLGHSSGADIATGFLFGLAALGRERPPARGSVADTRI